MHGAAVHPVRPRASFPLALLALGHFTVSVDFNIVYVALPEIGRSVGFSAQSLQWVVSAYALGFGGLLLLGGRTADRVGPRRTFTFGLVLFGAASLAGGLAGYPGMLVAARAGQGVAAALIFPSTLALIGVSFGPGTARNRAMAVWGTAGAFGALAGGAAGGVLTSFFGWRAVFLVMVPLTLGAALAVPRALPAGARPAGPRRDFDARGAVLATVGSLLLVAGLVSGPETGWATARGAVSVAAGAAVLGVFLAVERRTRDALVPVSMLRTRTLAVAMALISVVMGPVTALHYLYTTYLQDVLGYQPLATGLGLMPQGAVAMAASAFLLPVLLSRWNLRFTLAAGMLGVGLTSAVFALGVAGDGSYLSVLPALLLLGLTAGTLYPAIFAAATSEVPADRQGVASALTSSAQQVGGAVGLAVLVAVSRAGLDAGSAGGVATGLRAAAWVAAALSAAAALLALLVPGSGRALRRDADPARGPRAADSFPDPGRVRTGHRTRSLGGGRAGLRPVHRLVRARELPRRRSRRG